MPFPFYFMTLCWLRWWRGTMKPWHTPPYIRLIIDNTRDGDA